MSPDELKNQLAQLQQQREAATGRLKALEDERDRVTVAVHQIDGAIQMANLVLSKSAALPTPRRGRPPKIVQIQEQPTNGDGTSQPALSGSREA